MPAVQSLSHVQLFATPQASMPGFPVLHHLPEFAHTHVYSADDAVQPSSSVIPFSSWPQSFPASWSFPVSWLFPSGGQRIGTLTSASVLPMNIQGWFPLRLTDLTSLLSKGLSGAFSSITVQRHQFCGPLPSSWSCSHKHVTNGKTIASTIWTFVSRVMSLFFNILSRLVIAFLPRSKSLLISWLQSLSAVILEPKK